MKASDLKLMLSLGAIADISIEPDKCQKGFIITVISVTAKEYVLTTQRGEDRIFSKLDTAYKLVKGLTPNDKNKRIAVTVVI